jgi:hypothetical protein
MNQHVMALTTGSKHDELAFGAYSGTLSSRSKKGVHEREVIGPTYAQITRLQRRSSYAPYAYYQARQRHRR